MATRVSAESRIPKTPLKPSARILPFKKPRRRSEPIPPHLKTRKPVFNLSSLCKNNPLYKHEWVETNYEGWRRCIHCKGWELNTGKKVVNYAPVWTQRAQAYTENSKSGKHCLQKCADGRHVCCWCGTRK